MVHAAGILAFWVTGCGGLSTAASEPQRAPDAGRGQGDQEFPHHFSSGSRDSGVPAPGLGGMLLLAGVAVFVGTYDRSGLLAFLAAFGLCLFLKPDNRFLWCLVAIAVSALLFLTVTNIRVQMPGREREFSAAQLAANLTSLTGASRMGDLDDTKQWRLEWWGDIRDYTLQGRFFWTGKGFGINLADDDGYQVEEDGSLRNPHNGHLTMLARGGVPGLALWLLPQFAWAWGLLGAQVRSRRAGDRRWADLFLFLLAYWLAFMINATFDVFLEGPMGGIWFWTIFGVGLAALWLYKHNPELLAEAHGE
jgi:O-antigen ligase